MQRLKSAPVTARKRAGYTLMELMIVVVIVGVLSAMAVPTFSNYIHKSRTMEAVEFLGVIRLREEAYRAEFGAYCPTVAAGADEVATLDDPKNLVPDPTTTKSVSTMFEPPELTRDAWLQLGARPSGHVRFGYGVVAGRPTKLPAGLGFEGRPDFWWVARAVADLDGDGQRVMFETYSAGRGIFIGDHETGEPIAKGWE